MLCFLEDVTKWLDEGSPVDIIYLDLKKAFDKVPHQRLLLKLKAHGIGNGMINWIEKWLIDRRQRVVVDGEVSNWKAVLSGVPQGSVLGPILFLIYINDLDDDITSKVLKFADDTKVYRKIKSDADRQHLQDDLNKLIEWSEKWQMLFNFGKCKCLHTRHGNEDAQYTMGGTVLNTTLKEKDLGLTISADMKVSEQCGIAAAKGNQILGLIRRNIVYKEKELIILLYKTIVRPLLEYCIQAWRPYRKKDIDMLERVQRRATKMMPKLRNISYEMRLKECGLTTLETRRLRGDQIEVFKILNGYENIDRNIFFTVKEEMRTRGHEQCGIAAAKGNQILELIRQNILYKEKELLIMLYKTIIRPNLEYCIQAWKQRVQRTATKIIPKLKKIYYEMRLIECGLTTLETRRLRDQIEVFKILNGYENIDKYFFSVKEERSHGVTLAKKQCRLDIRKF